MNTFQLKILAVVLMVIDHIGLYFNGVPFWFNWIGRLAYPLFLFCMVWGYHYTKSRPKYLLRLYLMGLVMAFIRIFLDCYFMYGEFGYQNHNIFVNLFLVGVLISIIEMFQEDKEKAIWMCVALFLVQLAFPVVQQYTHIGHLFNGDILTAFIPNLILNEYSIPFIVLGVAIYFTKEDKNLFIGIYILFCIYEFINDNIWDLTWTNFSTCSYQCLMIFSLPIMLRYNREKGPGLKYFFYIFYPAHTILLYFIANLFFNK